RSRRPLANAVRPKRVLALRRRMKVLRRGRRSHRLGGTLVGVVTSIALATGAAAPAVAAASTRHDVVLSNETTNTTWTVADVAAPIRTQPSAQASVMTRLRFQTPDGYLQSYILLREHWTASGPWVKLRIPMRPNGLIGWVQRSALDDFQRVHTEIVVNRAGPAGPNLTLYRNGRVVVRAPVGIGKPSTPTPVGHFWITEAFPSYDPFYGPFLLATSDYSVLSDWPGGGVIGLHGTHEPALVPGYPSHGCIRMHNSDILRVAAVASTGTPVLVR
ncbi:MAG: hypothetical protein QOD66_1583, partial [Solirubrobacteraceae bacterium]|nr:hypothetical protein [Solirubrobacteraceae bacterium]